MKKFFLFLLLLALPSHSWGAWALGSTINSGSVKGVGAQPTNIRVATGIVTVPVDAVFVVFVTFDNNNTACQSATDLTCSDTRGHTYTRLAEGNRSSGAIQDGVQSAIFVTQIVTALTNAGNDSVFVSSPGNDYAGAVSFSYFTVAAGNTWQNASSKDSCGSGTGSTITLSGLTSASYLWLGQIGVEGPSGDGFTQDADYTTLLRASSAGGSAVTNVTTNNAYRIFTGTQDTYNPTLGTSRDWDANYVALKEVAKSTSSYIPLLRRKKLIEEKQGAN